MVHAVQTGVTVILPGLEKYFLYRRGVICESNVNKGGNTINTRPFAYLYLGR